MSDSANSSGGRVETGKDSLTLKYVICFAYTTGNLGNAFYVLLLFQYG